MPRNVRQTVENAGGGQQIVVRQLNENANQLLGQAVARHIDFAKQALDTCIRRCQQGDAIAVVEGQHFFNIDFGNDRESLFRVLGVLDQTYHGLMTTSFIKVGATISTEQPEAVGNVSTYQPEPPPADGIGRPSRYRTNLQPSPEREYFERVNMRNGQLEATRAIKLHERLFEQQGRSISAVVTVIHEATHKFAGTVDRYYLDRGGAMPQGFTRNDALMNADSYAWFANNVGTYGVG